MELCSLCHLNLDHSQPEAVLLCNHTFHTNCLFTEVIFTGYVIGDTCPTCQTRFYTVDPDLMRARHDEKKQADNLKKYKLFIEADGSIADLKFIKKQIRILMKKKCAFYKMANAKKRLFREEASPINRILKDMQKKYMKQLSESTEQKEFSRERRMFTTYMNRFNRKYAAAHITLQDLCGVSQLKMPVWWSIASNLRTYSWRILRLFRLW